MANIEKIKVGSTSYDVRDASAAHALTDIANAGTNITFTTPTIDDFSIAGTGVTVTDGVASGFSSSSYVYKGIWNIIQPNTSFDFVIKFRLDSLSGESYLTYQKASSYTVFNLYVDTSGRLWFESQTDAINDFSMYVTSYAFATNVDYWVKLHYDQTYDSSRNRYYSSIYANVSTDGINYTQVRSKTGVVGKFRTSTDNFILGSNLSSKPFLGSIDLKETYFKDGNDNILWVASAPASVPQINATVPTVDQTYNASSANAQSGVAVASAISGKQDVSNLVTSVSSSSTNTQYPSAKCLYDLCGDIETLINAL